jgi:phospholipid/cholesterol/gamma-HCH transport system substrate-binding protein
MRKDFVARELTVEVVVGVFMVMVFLGLGYFTIILSRETWLGKKVVAEAVFDDVMGLRDGDTVIVRGMTVGKVRSLSLEDDGVHVEMTLDKPIEIREGYRMTIVTTSILGGRDLLIEQGPSDGRILPLEDTVFQGESPYDIMADAAELVNAIKKGMTEGGVIDNLKSATDQMNAMMTRVSEGKGTLGLLLSEDARLYVDLTNTVAAVSEVASRLEAGEGTLGRLLADATLHEDLSTSVKSLRNVLDRVERGEGTAGRLFSTDDRLYEDLSATIASLRRVAERLEKGEGMLGRLTTEDEKLYADLSGAIASLRQVAEKIAEGEGTIGRLVEDDALYEQAREVVTEVRGAIDDLRETTPVVTFTSIFFGAF